MSKSAPCADRKSVQLSAVLFINEARSIFNKVDYNANRVAPTALRTALHKPRYSSRLHRGYRNNTISPAAVSILHPQIMALACQKTATYNINTSASSTFCHYYFRWVYATGRKKHDSKFTALVYRQLEITVGNCRRYQHSGDRTHPLANSSRTDHASFSKSGLRMSGGLSP